MIDNKLNFFFKNQIWHIGGLMLLFYLGVQIVDFENSSSIFLGISSKNYVSGLSPAVTRRTILIEEIIKMMNTNG